MCMEKLFSVEDVTGLYWGKACSYTTCLSLQVHSDKNVCMVNDYICCDNDKHSKVLSLH